MWALASRSYSKRLTTEGISLTPAGTAGAGTVGEAQAMETSPSARRKDGTLSRRWRSPAGLTTSVRHLDTPTSAKAADDLLGPAASYAGPLVIVKAAHGLAGCCSTEKECRPSSLRSAT